MRWKGRRGSANIEDRRRRGGGGLRVGGAGGLGVLAIVAIGYFLGVDLTPLLDDTGLSSPPSQTRELSAAEQEAGQFVSVVLADTEEVWTEVFREQLGAEYDPATLVLFSGVTQSPCGGASGATGPFYCPADEKAYLDTAFFATMEQRLGAGGDFAAAYVVAHEIAHHVQDELGILSQANEIRQQVSEAESNAISVRIELMADCLAGVWAVRADERFDVLQGGDLDEALNAARQIGDDTLQRNAGRVPQPHTFTHGTSEQRRRWFQTGFDSGRIDTCDTFAADTL
ncbi:neutral zinc metallopeptidase [Psychromarinibacter halotolerans]|uniref:Neutral zinc metallopeptidase n=1 Tax=Psychromarinibacter halotolerans TaxID=1775175 RepID=A0ABV7GQV9_9RHOB|nr:neutral zinc metallopeptidase [Psychromarinibacter halotolerans]MDF0594798.1 neutral zinc metallopeptidase [Psychromarinibacter halotolerans]